MLPIQLFLVILWWQKLFLDTSYISKYLYICMAVSMCLYMYVQYEYFLDLFISVLFNFVTKKNMQSQLVNKK